MARSKKHYGSGKPRGGIPGKVVDSSPAASGKTPKRYDTQMKAYWGGQLDEAQDRLTKQLKARGLSI